MLINLIKSRIRVLIQDIHFQIIKGYFLIMRKSNITLSNSTILLWADDRSKLCPFYFTVYNYYRFEKTDKIVAKCWMYTCEAIDSRSKKKCIRLQPDWKKIGSSLDQKNKSACKRLQYAFECTESEKFFQQRVNKFTSNFLPSHIKQQKKEVKEGVTSLTTSYLPFPQWNKAQRSMLLEKKLHYHRGKL